MKILTANRLIDGEVVWHSAANGWVERIDGAEVARDTLAQERLRGIGKASFQRDEVVDVELIDVEMIDGRIVPVRLRERIRAAGPSNRLDLGKQAQTASQTA